MATEKWKLENAEKMKEYRREWYYKNREAEQQKARIRNKKQRKEKTDYNSRLIKWYKEYKSTLKCSRCPESDSRCLDFHHKDGEKKELEVSLAARRGWAKERLLKEIAKCEVLCANCHRKI
jgi:hypothetical protein